MKMKQQTEKNVSNNSLDKSKIRNSNKDVSYLNIDKLVVEGKHNKEAVDCFDEFLKENSKHFWAWFKRGVALQRIGRYNEALESHDEVIKIYRNFVHAWHRNGINN